MGHMSVLLQLPVALQVPTHGRHPAALPRPHPFARLQLIFPIVCLHFCTNTHLAACRNPSVSIPCRKQQGSGLKTFPPL